MSELLLPVTVVVLLILLVNIYLSWVKRKCPEPIVIDKCPKCPDCPDCPKCPDANAALTAENTNLRLMVQYLTLIIKKYESEKELYRLAHGYHQVYNSPKMEYLKKEIYRTIQRVKANPSTLRFFERNLNGVIE